jgi:hypothetical protein
MLLAEFPVHKKRTFIFLSMGTLLFFKGIEFKIEKD